MALFIGAGVSKDAGLDSWDDLINGLQLKILNNKFYLIELTPDPYCGRESSFSKAIMSNGYTYEESIGLLIQNCSKYYQTQYSNEIIHTL